MPILPVLKEPDPRLRQISSPIDTFTLDIFTLFSNMVDTMVAKKGVGLAAPQVGVPLRALVIDQEEKGYRKIANPEIIWASDKTIPCQEGCLSLPGVWAEVHRPDQIRLRFATEDGTYQEELFSDFWSICIQHEIDHLNGILFIDHLSKLKRTTLLQKYRRL